MFLLCCVVCGKSVDLVQSRFTTDQQQREAMTPRKLGVEVQVVTVTYFLALSNLVTFPLISYLIQEIPAIAFYVLAASLVCGWS